MASHFRNDERQDVLGADDALVTEIQQDVPTVIGELVTEVDPLALDGGVQTAVDPLPVISSPMPTVVPAPVAAPTPEPSSLSPVANPYVATQAAVPTVTAQPVAAQVPQMVPTVTDAAPRPAQVPTIPAGTTPTISLRHVTMIYPSQPNKPALDDISLDIYPGEFVFLVGHSGSGKSTFIRLLNREIKATKGEVNVAGKDLTKMRNRKVPYLRRQIGCVFQDFKLLPDKTIYENVAFALECIGKPRAVIRAEVPMALDTVGLKDRLDAYPDQLSGGEQQRVAIARAIVNRPPLLICDEPTGNLDPIISKGIMDLLQAVNEADTTIVMATHDRAIVNAYQKRVIALEAGRLVRDQERGGYDGHVIL